MTTDHVSPAERAGSEDLLEEHESWGYGMLVPAAGGPGQPRRIRLGRRLRHVVAYPPHARVHRNPAHPARARRAAGHGDLRRLLGRVTRTRGGAEAPLENSGDGGLDRGEVSARSRPSAPYQGSSIAGAGLGRPGSKSVSRRMFVAPGAMARILCTWMSSMAITRSAASISARVIWWARCDRRSGSRARRSTSTARSVDRVAPSSSGLVAALVNTRSLEAGVGRQLLGHPFGHRRAADVAPADEDDAGRSVVSSSVTRASFLSGRNALSEKLTIETMMAPTDRGPEAVDVPAESTLPADPGGEQQHAGVDHDQEQPERQQQHRDRDQREDRLHDRVQHTEDQRDHQQREDLRGCRRTRSG